MAEFLGQPQQLVAAVQPAADGAAFAVRGFAVLPPHGYPSTGRQAIYVNGRPVKAAAVARRVDGAACKGMLWVPTL